MQSNTTEALNKSLNFTDQKGSFEANNHIDTRNVAAISGHNPLIKLTNLWKIYLDGRN